MTDTTAPQQPSLIERFQSALSVAEAKVEGAQQMINELTNANVHLRAGTLLLTKQVTQLQEMMAANKDQTRALDEVAHGELIKENTRLKTENDRLNRVVAAFDNKLISIHMAAAGQPDNGAVTDDCVNDNVVDQAASA